jgi:hypothetical protein
VVRIPNSFGLRTIPFVVRIPKRLGINPLAIRISKFHGIKSFEARIAKFLGIKPSIIPKILELNIYWFKLPTLFLNSHLEHIS